MERRLGRGLASLITQAPQQEAPPSEIEVGRIRPNPFQPRTVFERTGLDELATSIRNHGVIQPIALRPAGDGFEIISGERRWRAAQEAGLDRIPAVVREEVSDQDMLELALVENVQRVDLNPIERAEGFRNMMTALELTQEAVADKVGLKRSTVANHVRLLELPDAVREMVSADLLSMGHARAILGLPGEGQRLELAKVVARQGLSVRETEQRVRSAGQLTSRAKTAPGMARSIEPWAAEMQNRMRDSLGTKIAVENGANYRGRIVIDYYGRDELERIYGILAPREEV